ncbi:MAG: response regulator [Candidatus Schekmanbacteria bacterium]|nr:response regulator [Candidatus Schekmanbacteria bacterium]
MSLRMADIDVPRYPLPGIPISTAAAVFGVGRWQAPAWPLPIPRGNQMSQSELGPVIDLFDFLECAAFVVDAATDEIQAATPAAEELTGARGGRLVGVHHSELYEPEEARAAVRDLAVAGRPAAAPAVCCRISRVGGRDVPVAVRCLSAALGGGSSTVYAVRDLDAMRQVEAPKAAVEAAERPPAPAPAPAPPLEEQRKDEESGRKDLVSAKLQHASFLATVSRELQVPLTGIVAAADLLGHTQLSADQSEWVWHAGASARHLLAFADSLGELARLDLGKATMRPGACDLRKLVGEVREKLLDHAKEKKIDIRIVEPLPAEESLVGMPVEIKRALSLLVKKAVQRSGRDDVRISAQLLFTGDGTRAVRIKVEDSAPAIPADQMVQIFVPFAGVQFDSLRDYGDTGMELALFQRLVEAMGGKAGARSHARSGNAFWFDITMQRASAPLAAQGAVPQPSAEPERGRVLLAEDERLISTMVSGVLRSAGYAVDEVPNGALAVKQFAMNAYDLILMDADMPVLDGMGAAREIRRREKPGERVPIVALTAHAKDSQRAACLASGMDFFVTKPIDEIMLKRAVQHWIEIGRGSGAGK